MDKALISRSAAIDEIGKLIKEYRENGEYDLADAFILTRRYVIKQLPAVDAAPVIHGRWIKSRFTKTYFGHTKTETCYVCSVCEKTVDDALFKYCPHCGAIMDGDASV